MYYFKPILTFFQAVASDCSYYLSKAPVQAPGLENESEVLGFQFNDKEREWFLTEHSSCLVFWDEIHVGRTLNRYFAAATRLRINSAGFVGLTATPLLSKPAVSFQVSLFILASDATARIHGILGAFSEFLDAAPTMMRKNKD